MDRAYVKLSLIDGDFFTVVEGQIYELDGSAYVRPMQLLSPLLRDDGEVEADVIRDEAMSEELLFRCEGQALHRDPDHGDWVFIQAPHTIESLQALAEQAIG